MKTSVVVLAVLSLAILVSVSGGDVVQAREGWLGPDVVAATNGLSPGEAVITWDRVAEGSYYRVGWAAKADLQSGVGDLDFDADWSEGFVFADVTNRGQASHLITGLMPGIEYQFLVASHHGQPAVLRMPAEFVSLRLRSNESVLSLGDTGSGRYDIDLGIQDDYGPSVGTGQERREPTSSADAATRSRATHSITGSEPQLEYHAVVVGQRDAADPPQSHDRDEEWQLVRDRSSPQTVSYQNFGDCEVHESVQLPMQQSEEVARYWCRDDEGTHYWIFVPTAYLDPDAIAEQIHERTFDELSEVENRVEAYRTLIVELASQRALGDRAHLETFVDFFEGRHGQVTDAKQIIGDVIDAYGLEFLAGSQQYHDLENHIQYLIEHPDIYGDKPYGSVEYDASIMAAVSRTIFIDTAREHLRLLEQLPMDSAWTAAIAQATEILNQKSSGADLATWGEELEARHDEIVATLEEGLKFGAYLTGTAIGAVFGIAASPIAVILSTVVVAGFEIYERFHETNEFWDDITFATVAAQAYWHTYRNRHGSGSAAVEARTDLLGYTEFAFYQHLYLAATNPRTRAALIRIWSLGATNPSQFAQTLLERRDIVLDRIADSPWEPSRELKGPEFTEIVEKPQELCAQGTTMWVFDYSFNSLFDSPGEIHSFDLETKLPGHFIPNSSFPLRPLSMTCDQTTVWVAGDSSVGPIVGKLHIHTYNPATNEWNEILQVDPEDDSEGPGGFPHAGGMWSDGETLWITGTAYNLKNKKRDPYKDFAGLGVAGNDSPVGIWSDGTTMWVADSADGKIYAYDMETSNQDVTREFNLLDVPGVISNTDPFGIWSDGTTMWVSNSWHSFHFDEEQPYWKENKIFAYQWPPKRTEVVAFPFGRSPEADLGRLKATENEHAEGIWFDQTTMTMWVADHDDDRIYGYDMETKLLVGTIDTLREEGNGSAKGIWSDGTTMWVADHDDDRIYAYRLSDGERVEDSESDDLLKDAGNQDVTGIWFDRTTMTMWAADHDDDRIYGYDMVSKNLIRTIDTLKKAGNEHAEGIWSDGTTIWVADHHDDRIYAYRLSDGEREREKEFDTPGAAGNRYMKGIWSDGATMWVADQDKHWIYAYNMPEITYPLGNPTNLVAAPGSQNGEVTLSWSPAANATVQWVYLVKPDGTDGRYWPHALAGDAATLTITGLDAGETYLFLVIAGQEQADGTTRWSQWSNWGQATLPATAPASPASAATNSISSGSSHTCGLRADGAPVCWGDNRHGEATPPAGETFTAISSGYIHTCGLRADGAAVCWGDNDYRQATPPAGETFAAISSGAWHTCGLRADGAAVCWGNNNYGQATPPAGATFAAISGGAWHTCGLRADGAAVCWGQNFGGQATPPAGENFAAISSGQSHTCGLRADGAAVCWGRNYSGQATPPAGETSPPSAAAVGTRAGCAPTGRRSVGARMALDRRRCRRGKTSPPSAAVNHTRAGCAPTGRRSVGAIIAMDRRRRRRGRFLPWERMRWAAERPRLLPRPLRTWWCGRRR